MVYRVKLLAVLAGVVLAGGAGWLVWQSARAPNKSAYTWSIRQKDASRPRIISLTADPKVPALGDTQTLSVTAAHPTPLSAVFITISTDTNTWTLLLDHVSRQGEEEVWQAQHVVDDPISRTYRLQVVAESEGYTSTAVVTPLEESFWNKFLL